MTNLSPAAKAVLDAYKDARDGQYVNGEWIQDEAGQVAAALRAAADQVVPLPRLPYDSCCDVSASAIRAELLAIAAELEGAK